MQHAKLAFVSRCRTLCGRPAVSRPAAHRAVRFDRRTASRAADGVRPQSGRQGGSRQCLPHRGGEPRGLHLIVATDCLDLAETMPACLVVRQLKLTHYRRAGSSRAMTCGWASPR